MKPLRQGGESENSGDKDWQRQCSLSERECFRSTSAAHLQLSCDMHKSTTTVTGPESCSQRPETCSSRLQTAIDEMCNACVSPVCSSGGQTIGMGIEQFQIMRGYYSPERQASLQTIGTQRRPLYDIYLSLHLRCRYVTKIHVVQCTVGAFTI
jgi:hypothetical protein